MADKPAILVALIAEDQEFQRLQGEDARATAARNGLSTTVVYGANNAILQIQQLYQGIHAPVEQRPIAIIVETIVGEGLERVAKAAVRAGVAWILINRKVPYLRTLRAENPSRAIGMVGTDQLEIGRIQARQVRALLPTAQGLVICIQGPEDTSVAKDRLLGLQEGLGGSKVRLKVLNGNWTDTSGQEAIESWLRLKSSAEERPDVVVCQNDAMAQGAARALKAFKDNAEFARIPLTGCDGLVDGGQRLVDMRQLAATVVAPSNTGAAVELVARLVKTGQLPPEEQLLKPTSYPNEADLARRVAARNAVTPR